VKPAVRLDVVVKLRERDEEKARIQLAEAQRQAMAAAQALDEVQRRAVIPARARGTAAEWLMADVAAVRAREDVRKAEVVAKAADQKLGAQQKHYAGALAKVEVMRKVADARRDELLAAADRVEAKVLDEAARLMYVRR
jgi:flagellar biosynthesis chaperone FliJ